MDLRYWNSTLRCSPRGNPALEKLYEDDYREDDSRDNGPNGRDYFNGLLFLSVKGNAIAGHGLGLIARVLHHNSWLLGLDLSNNRLETSVVTSFMSELVDHDYLRIILLHDNPGYSVESIKLMKMLLRKPMAEHFQELPIPLLKVIQRWTQAQERYFAPRHMSNTLDFEELNNEVRHMELHNGLPYTGDVSASADGHPSVGQLRRRIQRTAEVLKDFDERHTAANSRRRRKHSSRKPVQEDAVDGIGNMVANSMIIAEAGTDGDDKSDTALDLLSEDGGSDDNMIGSESPLSSGYAGRPSVGQGGATSALSAPSGLGDIVER
jgi:hypothetical protein